MILSMTGFGRAEDVFEGKKITIDIKSLNSKSFDLNIKIPLRYKEKEFEILKKDDEVKTLELQKTRLIILSIILVGMVALGVLNYTFLGKKKGIRKKSVV